MSDNFWETKESIKRYTLEYRLWDSEIRFIFKAVQNLRAELSEIKILDLGCGAGRTTIPLHEMGFDVIGLDISKNLIEELNKKNPKINCLVGDAKNLNFPKETFDIVIFSHNSLDCLETIEERETVLKEVNKVLKKKGYFIFSSHYFNLLVSNLFSFKNVIVNFKNYIFNRESGYYIEKMENGQTLSFYYTNVNMCEKQLNKFGFKLYDYTSLIDTSKNHIKDLLKGLTSWEIYYSFQKNPKD
jgi:ubiquinone/menaquinone biosynthesis C-methylase UbiE